MNYYDKNKKLLSHNDYVEVITEDIGIHKGYIRSFYKNGMVKVCCLVGEICVPINKIRKIGKLNR